MAAHGISRATADVDLLTVDPGVLMGTSWAPLAGSGAAVRVTRGDPEDPLAGAVRLERANDAESRELWERIRSGMTRRS